MRFRRSIAALVAVAVIGLTPAVAPAQSGGAGDDQYQDPFGSNGQQQSGGSTGSSTPSPAPAPAQTTAPSTTASSGQTTAPAASSNQTLPRTGADVGIVVAIGAALLLAGAVLRRRLRHERL